MRIRSASVLTLLALSVALSGCKKKPEPVLPPPTAEAIAAFAEAAFNGNTAQVSAALKTGMPVDQVETNGNSALMLASFNGHVETIQVLLDAGAKINLHDGNGRTPLMFAASGPFPAAVKLLLEKGADINATDKVDHFSALMFAAAEGLSPIVDILLEKGADPKLKDKDNDTAASFARKRGFTALADKLQALIDAP
ncbi:MAG: ankyrin repeat domain-containing protein [Kiritimatiellaceae bacterium]|nr:ankyrin repeat domain-containing protein [Kiritimatiellaceae bacterium]